MKKKKEQKKNLDVNLLELILMQKIMRLVKEMVTLINQISKLKQKG